MSSIKPYPTDAAPSVGGLITPFAVRRAVTILNRMAEIDMMLLPLVRASAEKMHTFQDDGMMTIKIHAWRLRDALLNERQEATQFLMEGGFSPPTADQSEVKAAIEVWAAKHPLAGT